MSAVWARVARVHAGRVWLQLEDRPGGCGRCDSPGGCGTSNLSHLFKAPAELVELPATPGIAVGERVMVRVAEGAPLRAALASYGLPVVFMLLGAALLMVLSPFASADGDAFAGTAGGLIAGILASRAWVRRGRWQAAMEISICRGDNRELLREPAP